MPELTVERHSRTALLTLARPEARNSLTRGLVTGLTEALRMASADKDVRCIVLAGAGENFCAGADLRRNFAEDPALLDKLDAYMDEYHALIGAIVRSSKPVLAMVDGCAVGFGADLALACDMRIVTPRAYVQEKFVKIGLMPDGGGTFWLPRLVGTARAMEMILLAERVEGPKMVELGIAARMVAPDELRKVTLAIAAEIEAGPPLAYAEIRRALYASWGDLEGALRREREGQLKLLRSGDVMEGVAAWMQKREPVFQGQ
ncbi:MAG: enoyl-CoA hydratase-related protein [Polyangiaceae bacterium]